MVKNYYEFNSSQDVIDLQTRYTIWKRVVNIVFSVTVKDGFDRDIMRKALDKLFERNDCLRITFVKRNGRTVQYFEEKRCVGNIPDVVFDTDSSMRKYINRFRRKPTDCFKGDTLDAVFAVNPSGESLILFKVSHFVADTYGIGVLVKDLFRIYDALKNHAEMPPVPGSFEKVLKRDIAYKENREAVERDRLFFKEYYTQRHAEHPMFCGIHGNTSDLWLKEKKKGRFSMPYIFVKCDTESFKFVVPKAVTENVRHYCEDNQVPMGTFFFYILAIGSSLVNDRAPIQAPLELLNCRGTLEERNAGGTKVQSMSVYTVVDYSKSFKDNLAAQYADQQELYRHTRLSYLEIQELQRKFWKFSALSQILNHAYSFIPFDAPDGVSLQVLSNGKGALPAYIAFMYNMKTSEVEVIYDIQTIVITPQVLVDFQNLLIQITEKVITAPDIKLADLF